MVIGNLAVSTSIVCTTGCDFRLLKTKLIHNNDDVATNVPNFVSDSNELIEFINYISCHNDRLGMDVRAIVVPIEKYI